MKKSFKILALLLSLVMMLSVFAACDNGSGDGDKTGDEETTTTGSGETTVSGSESNNDSNSESDSNKGETTTKVEEVTEVMPDIDKKDYGAEFYLSVLNDTNPMDHYWVEESNNDVLSAALYDRQEKVKNYLGVEVLASMAGHFETYTEDLKTAVKNKSGGIDTLLTHVSSGVSGLITGAYLTPFGDLPGVDLDADYWNQDFMEALSVCDEYLLGFSDFNILYTYVIAYNVDLLAKYDDALNKSVYQMVDDYEWTLQQFIDIAKLGHIDNGSVEKSQYGLTGQLWVPWCGFLEACGVNLVEINDKGMYEISYMNDVYKERTQNIVTALTELAASKEVCVDYQSVTAPKVPFESGRALMTLTATINVDDYLNYDIDFGVLPYPTYDTNQKEYRSLQWGGYLAVPAFLEDEEMVGETLEMLSFFSEDVKTAYYQKLLGKQIADNPDDRRMLEIIWDSVCTDFGQTFDEISGNPLYMLPIVTSGTTSLTSFYEGRTNGGNKSIINFLKKVDKKY
ncbi:MAG: extracellular solute-binding protein [Ruminococcaceae bacterium]|nr:extracellular solute-binding protein [Oscillospiraceae bacterium]